MWNPTDVFPFSPSIEGIANTWLYVNNEDSIGTITSAGFLATGGEMGMQVGDLVWVINQITPSSVVCQVTAITHGGTQNFPVSATIMPQPGPPGGAVNSVHNTDGSLIVTPTTGVVVAKLSNTGVVAGAYTNADITVDAQGRVLVIASGIGNLGTTSTITSGATVGSPFLVPVSTGTILVNKTIAAASYVTFPLAASMLSAGTLVKDVKGDANTNNINIQFTSGQLCDGTALVVIGTKYGNVTINPLPGGTGWYSS